MALSELKLQKLTDLFMDLAKGMFLSALAIPAFSPLVTAISSLRLAMIGIFLVALAFKAIDYQEGGV